MITDVKRERVAMTREEAKRFWAIRYENAKDYSDPHWEAQERREHREYVEALRMAIEALSAEAEPTVIRCKTLLNAEDFEAVATRIRKENRNVIVIPCETEVASAEAVQGWIPVTERMPDIGELVLITQNRGDGDKTVETAYLTSDGPNDLYWSTGLFKSRETDEVLAWMPLPKPYEPKTERRG